MATSTSGDGAEAAGQNAYKRVQYAVLGREGIEFKMGPNKRRGEISERDDPDTRFEPNKVAEVNDFEYCSGDGSKVALLRSSGFCVMDTDSGKLVCEVSREGIYRVAFSPLGTFLLSWERHKGGDEGNLIVWRVSDGAIVFRAVEKNLLNTTWPSVKWSDDELVAAHMVTNTVHIYDGVDFSKSHTKLRSEGLTQFAITKRPGEPTAENPLRIATFKPEIKSSPAKISVYNFPGSLEQPVGGKTFFKAQEADLKWSPTGNAVLCKTETDVDTTGQSYYGESALYLLHSDGQFDCKILPAKEGSFHDFAWSPEGKTFVAISGKSPASSLLYNIKGDPIFDFGVAHRNTIRWSPHGRFLCIGGFGNLLGDMDFWDINKKAKMGSVRANCAVTQQWSPCGRFFMTSTLFPRMRVDNGVTFYTYRGDLVCTVAVREASKALWRPAAPGVYSDRPQTPLKKLRKAAGNGAGAAAAPAQPPNPKPVGVYRPPGSSGSLAAMMRSEHSGPALPRSLGVPGSTVVGGPKVAVMPQKSKAALRRERKKKAAGNAGANASE